MAAKYYAWSLAYILMVLAKRRFNCEKAAVIAARGQGIRPDIDLELPLRTSHRRHRAVSERGLDQVHTEERAVPCLRPT
ncbi:hypothetical protein B0H10DRAFT_1994791 [Mycena sp. CBHHK59/15]|nr:hypothetical protein B0H10DRAFT_1994791 [Mycena sp. CBHHK59/15]